MASWQSPSSEVVNRDICVEIRLWLRRCRFRGGIDEDWECADSSECRSISEEIDLFDDMMKLFAGITFSGVGGNCGSTIGEEFIIGSAIGSINSNFFVIAIFCFADCSSFRSRLMSSFCV
jgi:hypothetical protein